MKEIVVGHREDLAKCRQTCTVTFFKVGHTHTHTHLLSCSMIVICERKGWTHSRHHFLDDSGEIEKLGHRTDGRSNWHTYCSTLHAPVLAFRLRCSDWQRWCFRWNVERLLSQVVLPCQRVCLRNTLLSRPRCVGVSQRTDTFLKWNTDLRSAAAAPFPFVRRSKSSSSRNTVYYKNRQSL